MKAENRGNEGFLQRESVEHQGYAEARSTDRSEGKERDGASDLLEAILDRDNLNRAYKRVKSNHGAAGIDGMSVEEALPWLREHREELLQSIRDGSYEPSPVRRKEITKPDGGVRKLGIPTVVDRVIQQGIAQKLQNIWEPQFSDSSYGYRPKRSSQQAIQKVKEYAAKEGAEVVVISAKVESEIAELDGDDAKLFLEELGLTESGLDKLIKGAFELLGLLTFLTAGPDECRAWTIVRGTTAPKAAGKIHSDIERGFIRAEIVNFDDLVAAGSTAAAREKGQVRLEGKDYVMQDGDVTYFRFNV